MDFAKGHDYERKTRWKHHGEEQRHRRQDADDDLAHDDDDGYRQRKYTAHGRQSSERKTQV